MLKDCIIFAGQAGLPLAEEVAKTLLTRVAPAKVSRFNDGEVRVQLGPGQESNARGKHAFIINPTNMPHENIYDLLMLAEAVRGSRPKDITLVVPYLAYNRQDRTDVSEPRTPVSAAVMIRQLISTGADGILLLDIHSEATQGIFHPMKVGKLYGSVLALPYFKELLQEPYIIAAPDHGAVSKARWYAKRLGDEGRYLIFDKARAGAGKVGKVSIIGDLDMLKDADVLFVDDMADTCGTLIADAIAAKEAGARRVFAFVTHGIFSGDAVARLEACAELDLLVTTDSICHPPKKLKTKREVIKVISVAPLIARAIHNILNETSISELSG